MFQTNLIMPEPTVFLDQRLGPVAIIRPTSDQQGAQWPPVVSFVEDGLFLDLYKQEHRDRRRAHASGGGSRRPAQGLIAQAKLTPMSDRSWAWASV